MIRTRLSDLAYNARVSDGAFDTILVKPTDSDARLEKAQRAREEFSLVTFTSDFTGLMGVGRKKFGKWEVEYSGLAFMVEVIVGINVNNPHTDLKGNNDCTMGELLHSLNYYGYDPLFSIKNKEYRDSKQRELARFVLSDLKRQRAGDFKSSHHTITERVRRWARGIRDDARDYVRGETADPKMFLDEKTIRTRKYKQAHYTGPYGKLYQEGLNEALWESGQLEMSIEVLSVRIVKRFKRMSQAVKNRKAYHKRYDSARYFKKDRSELEKFESRSKLLEMDIRKERKAAAEKAVRKIAGSAKWVQFKNEADKLFGKYIGKTRLHTFDWLMMHTSESSAGDPFQEKIGKSVDEFLLSHGFTVDDLYNAPPI